MANILVADDSPTILKVVEQLLVPIGHEVRTVQSGLDLLAAVHEDVPDLLLLDIMLPDADGIELCILLRRKPALKSLPIIMITSLQNQYRLASHVGADDYITKPFSPERLLKAVSQYVNDGRGSPGRIEPAPSTNTYA